MIAGYESLRVKARFASLYDYTSGIEFNWRYWRDWEFLEISVGKSLPNVWTSRTILALLRFLHSFKLGLFVCVSRFFAFLTCIVILW
jgi:hypothetical protein